MTDTGPASERAADWPTLPSGPAPAAPHMATASPRTVGICDQSPTTLLVGPPRSTSHPCELASGHTGWHEADGMRWSSEPELDTDLLTVDGLTAEQDIRVRALTTAMALFGEIGLTGTGDVDEDCDFVLEVADRFAAYIATGAHPHAAESTPVDTEISTCTDTCCYSGAVAREPSSVEAP